ncbi:hypothetical protein TA5113_00664 [Cognatishimia activa]|nr:hypothetical protein TA5113_00664 [Cognatishimia activa]
METPSRDVVSLCVVLRAGLCLDRVEIAVPLARCCRTDLSNRAIFYAGCILKCALYWAVFVGPVSTL